MLDRHALGHRTVPTVFFLSGRSEDVFELKRRVGDTARLVVGAPAEESLSQLRGSFLGMADSLVIDRRGLPARRLAAIETLLARRRLDCRILFLHAPSDGARKPERSSCHVTLGDDESPAAYAAAVHFGSGRHELLFEAMQALLPLLTRLGRQVACEVLASRFFFHHVNVIAKRLGLHRTRLHRGLLAAGDPSPKRLVDACYAVATALILREPVLGTGDLLRFLRAKDLRTPRDAVGRCTGLDLASLRRLARNDWGRCASTLIANRLMERASAREAASPRTSQERGNDSTTCPVGRNGGPCVHESGSGTGHRKRPPTYGGRR